MSSRSWTTQPDAARATSIFRRARCSGVSVEEVAKVVSRVRDDPAC
jgi:hypothetical protein